MNLQGYGYGIHNIRHKGHDAYIQILLKAAFLKACDVDSESSLTKLQGMLGPLWQVKLPSSSSETRVRAFPALLPIGRAHCASRPTSFCVSVQQICQMDRNPAGSCNLGVILTNLQGFLGGASVKKKKKTTKNLPADAGDTGDVGSIPGWGRFPGGGHGNPLQCACLKNPMERGAWRAIAHGVTKSWT